MNKYIYYEIVAGIKMTILFGIICLLILHLLDQSLHNKQIWKCVQKLYKDDTSYYLNNLYLYL